MARALAVAAGVAQMLVCASCGSTPPKSAVAPPSAEDRLSESLAQAHGADTPDARASAYLDALRMLHPDDDSALAAEIVAELRTEPLAAALTPFDRFRVDAIALELALAEGDRAEIEALAAALNPVADSQRRQADYLRAYALADADDPQTAALALLAIIDRLDVDGGDLSVHTAAAWRHLSRLPIPTLRRLAQTAASASIQSWMDIALAFNAALTSQQQASIWQRFRTEHPDHVAARFPPHILLDAEGPSNIALLLPFSGSLANLAAAIRDGFLAAYLQAQLQARHDAGGTQTVRFYDTGALAAAEAYRQAIVDGADIIVGPLEKAAVAELAMLPPERPIVALNNFEDVEPGHDHGTVQLALAPEDDATAIGAALAAADVERVAIFANAEPWSVRARRRFEAGSGAIEVVAVGALVDNSEATTVAGDVLGVTASQARHAALAELLATELAFVPRRRNDVDAIVAFVNGQQLMALKPTLDFHFAADLPLYAPSQAVRGVSWGRLEGLRVCNIPWLLHAEPLRRETNALATSSGPLASLFALGVDGFRIANQLVRMTVLGESIAGSTGVLSVGENGRIRRQLAWGRVSNGRLIAIPTP